MNNFNWIMTRIYKSEGWELTDDPTDPGRETFAGISRIYHPYWSGWLLIDSGEYDKLELLQEVDSFYFHNYWVPMLLEDVSVISREVACRMMNIAIHRSRYWAILWLQMGLNLLNINQRLYPDIEEDGLLGKRTMETIKRYFSYDTPLYDDKVDMLTGIMRTFQNMHYIEKMRKSPAKEKYRGWFLRAERDSCR